MQCPSCGFQNLPNLETCARCNSRLALDDVSVQPYRAQDRGRLWRRWRHVYERDVQVGRRLRSLWTRLKAGINYEPIRQLGGGVPWWVRAGWVLASVLPGLGQRLSGRAQLGWYLLGGYALALLGLILFLSPVWWLFLAILVGIHAFAIVDCLFYKVTYVSRLLVGVTGVVAFIALLYGPYAGVGWLINGVVRLEYIGGNVGNLKGGDVLAFKGRWFSTSDEYGPGDVVLYHIDRQAGQGWYIAEGMLLDRILAGPGDRVSQEEGQLLVNGHPLPDDYGLPSRLQLPERLNLLLSPNTYFIYPTVPIDEPPGQRGWLRNAKIRSRLSCVHRQDIRGNPSIVVSPFWRIGRL